MNTLMLQFSHKPKTWVELPRSKYGIEYDLGQLSSLTKPPGNQKSGIQKLWRHSKKFSKTSPFEKMLCALNGMVVRDGHGPGTALMYIREIFEPGDDEFEFIDEKVFAAQLSSEHVDRMRIMVLPWRREARLMSYLNRFSSNNCFCNNSRHSNTQVLDQFESFQRLYLSVHDPMKKFDELFGFSFAIKRRSDWIFEYEDQRKRERMMADLAKHWRKLMARHSAEQLGLDQEFSFPALLQFLKNFQQLCDSIETFGKPPIRFIYRPTSRMKVVTFDFDDAVSSLTSASPIVANEYVTNGSNINTANN